MYPGREKAIFENRYDAGRQLAAKLTEYKGLANQVRGLQVVVLAIPNGGVPVGLEVALALEADFDLVVARKIPLPFNPEAGFGAVADDGSVLLNDEIVGMYSLTREQIDFQVEKVRAEIKRRRMLYRQDRPPALVSGRTVIITDDGLASGFTMKAVVSSMRSRRPREIIVAVPCSSASALEEVSKVADKVVTVAVGSQARFAVADFYKNWHDVPDDEVFRCLDKFRQARFKAGAEPRRNR
ncbi:MAG: phosphoribosyl transferase [Chloroflexi bacterium]|nr:phosphoribosyl transferase [Chloroflexota bacterium]